MASGCTTRTLLGKTISIDKQKYYASQISAIYLHQSGSFDEFTFESLYNYIFNDEKFLQISQAYIKKILFNAYCYENSSDSNHNFKTNVNVRAQWTEQIQPNTRIEIAMICTSATTAVNVGYYCKYYHEKILFLQNKFIKIPRIQNMVDRYCITSFYLFISMQLRDCIGNKIKTETMTHETIAYSICFHYDGVGKGEAQVILNGKNYHA